MTPCMNTVWHVSESIIYLGFKIWAIVPVKMEEISSVNSYQKQSFLS